MKKDAEEFDYDFAVYAGDLEEENEKLKEIIDVYKIQFSAAMRAKSLGLCKKVISHALTDHKKLEKEI
jgi:hypothetical protein